MSQVAIGACRIVQLLSCAIGVGLFTGYNRLEPRRVVGTPRAQLSDRHLVGLCAICRLVGTESLCSRLGGLA